jgi:NhaA family Na+:H+ antiporter
MAEHGKIPGDFVGLPKEPIDVLGDPFKRFLHIEASSGVLLLVATVTALVLANSPLAGGFLSFWKARLGFSIGSFSMIHSLQHWINDGLMAIFFFVVGLEVKREMVMGELQDLKQASLPIAAAFGGMVVPAGIYFLLQQGTPAARGWGIPMATDIAFVVGCMAVLGSRIPNSLRVMMLSLAIVDDIGAILVIAIGYTTGINLTALALAFLGIGIFLFMMKIGIRNIPVILILMFLVWIAFHESGIHATVEGVIFGLLMPTEAWVSKSRLGKIVQQTSGFLSGENWENAAQRYALLRQMEIATRKSISKVERFEISLHPWVGFAIMPVFALANAGVPFELSDFTDPVAIAVIAGLFIGKPAGILFFSWIAVRTGLARLPEGVNWGALTGGGFLAGIGFTMALFIASLALEGDVLDAAKVGILAASFLSAVAGVVLLLLFLPRPEGKN